MLALEVDAPRFHEAAPPFEVVRSPVGQLARAPLDVRKGMLGYLARKGCPLRCPIAKRRPESMRTAPIWFSLSSLLILLSLIIRPVADGNTNPSPR